MPANDQSPEAEKPQPKIPPGDKADQKKNEEQPDKNEEDPEDRKIVLTIRLFNQDRESLDVGEYAKRRGLDEPLFRETILQRYDYRATEFGITDSVTPTMAWHSPVSLPFVAKKFEGKKFELFQVRAVAGSFLEITRFEPELVKFDLYSIKSDLPIASLSNELVPEDMELRPGLARLTNWARELAKDSDGTPEGITRRLRDELQTRGGFRYMQRNAVLANQDKPLDVDDFLFNEKQKRGHCEYFADALTLMLRSVNIPARTIGGLKGGEYQAGDINNRAGYLLMQKKHGHAWVEAHLNGRWQTVDGTPGGSNGVGQPLAAESSGEQPQVNPGQDPQVAQQVREMQQAQRQLTQEAQQLQKQVEQELGKDSPEAKQSQQTARLCES